MSWIVKHLNDTTITIVGHREPHVCDPRVYYKILVKSGPRTWMIERRYKEFANLNEVLVKKHGLNETWLARADVVGYRGPNFLVKRKEALEKFLQDAFKFLESTMPKSLTDFLEIRSYFRAEDY